MLIPADALSSKPCKKMPPVWIRHPEPTNHISISVTPELCKCINLNRFELTEPPSTLFVYWSQTMSLLCYPCSFGCCGHGYCSALSVYCHLVLQTVGLFVRQVEWDQECPQYSHRKTAWQPLISSVLEALVFLLHHQLFLLQFKSTFQPTHYPQKIWQMWPQTPLTVAKNLSLISD
jgi:hypothetical protein